MPENNIIAGKLNFITYTRQQAMRLKGSLQAGEVALEVISAANTDTIYSALDTGGFQVFNPASPVFSSLDRLEPGKGYAIVARQSYALDAVFPSPDPSFKDALVNWIASKAAALPLNVTAASPVTGSVTVTWQQPQIGTAPFSYIVQYSKDGGDWQETQPSTTLGYTYTGLEDASYQFRVREANANPNLWANTDKPFNLASAVYLPADNPGDVLNGRLSRVPPGQRSAAAAAITASLAGQSYSASDVQNTLHTASTWYHPTVDSSYKDATATTAAAIGDDVAAVVNWGSTATASTQATAASRPNLKADGLEFANQESLPFDGAQVTNRNYTIVLRVVRQTESPIVWIGGTAQALNQNLLIGYRDANTLEAGQYLNQITAVAPDFTVPVAETFVLRQSSTGRTLRRNGVLVASDSNASKLTAYANSAIGRYLASRFSQGLLKDFMIFQQSLSDSQAVQVERFLDQYSPFTPAVANPPGAPTLQSSSIGELVATWTAPSTANGSLTPTGYQVEYLRGASTWSNRITTDAATLTATWTQLAGGSYMVRVRAIVAVGYSEWRYAAAPVNVSSFGSAYFEARFTAPNNTVLSAYDPDYSFNGNKLAVSAGGFAVNSGALFNTPGIESNAFIDIGQTAYYVGARITLLTASSVAGILLRYSNDSNYLYAAVSSTGVSLISRVSGTNATIATFNTAIALNQEVILGIKVLADNNVTLYLNEAQILTQAVSALATNTGIGLRANSASSAKFDAFFADVTTRVAPAPAPPPPVNLTIVRDSFDAPENTIITSRTPEAGAIWKAASYSSALSNAKTTAAGRLRGNVVNNNANNYTFTYYSSGNAGAHYVEADLYVASHTLATVGICSRITVSQDSMYCLQYSINSTNKVFQLTKRINGVQTVLASYVYTVPIGSTARMRMVLEEFTKRMFVDGVEVGVAENESTLTTGPVGMRFLSFANTSNLDTEGLHLSNLEAELIQ